MKDRPRLIRRTAVCGPVCTVLGWKFDFTGQCIEVPSEPAESGFAKKIKLRSYRLVQRGGVLWTYMGPAQDQPPLPEWEFAMVAPTRRSSPSNLSDARPVFEMESPGGLISRSCGYEIKMLARHCRGTEGIERGRSERSLRTAFRQWRPQLWRHAHAMPQSDSL
jgi:hypothetical protein